MELASFLVKESHNILKIIIINSKKEDSSIINQFDGEISIKTFSI